MTDERMTTARIGLGCVTFGREIDEAASFALMDHAVAGGVRMFDTAAAYGGGASERIVGRWLASRRPENITIATKMLPPYSREHIERSIDESLERLGLRQLDWFYLHQWHSDAASTETLSALDALVRSGKVRALGLSNVTTGQLADALNAQRANSFARFSLVQNNHNLAVRDVTEPLRRLCAANNIAIVTYSPLGAGFLTGKHRPGVQSGSRFDLIPGHQAVYFHEHCHRRLARLEAAARRAGIPQARLALAWALHQPGIGHVLIGGRTPEHLAQAFAALDLDDEHLLSTLEDAPHPP